MDDNTDGQSLGRRLRKKTEKGQAYAEERGRAPRKDSDIPSQRQPPQPTKNKSSGNGKAAVRSNAAATAASKSSQATKTNNGENSSSSSNKTKTTVNSRGSHKRGDEFRIETLPSNRTSEKANTIDLRAHARAMPRSSAAASPAGLAQPVPSVRQDAPSGPRKEMSSYPHNASAAAAGSTSTNRRLTQEAAAQLAALRNPFAMPRGSSTGRPRASQVPSTDNERRPDSQTPQRATSSAQKPAPKHVEREVSSTSDDERDLREYHVSTSDRRAQIAQLPSSRADYRTREGTLALFEGEPSPRPAREPRRESELDYGSRPRARALAVAYQDTRRNALAASESEHEDAAYDHEDAGERRYREECRSDDDAGTVYDNDFADQFSPPANMQEPQESGAWSPQQTHNTEYLPTGRMSSSFDHTNSGDRVPRRRAPSEISYEGEPRVHQGPSQRRRITRDTSPSIDQRSSSPVQEGPEREGEHSERFRRDYPRAQRVVEPASGQRRRAKQSDYETDAQEVMNLAVVFYKGMVMTENAYPGKLLEKVWARTAWYQAAERLDVELTPTEEILQLISRYTWNLRGEIKAAARSFVQGAYGFKPLDTASAQDWNRRLAARLLRDRTFTYETIKADTDDHEGLYENSVIQMVVNQVFYKGANDDGVLLHDIYSPFPLKGLALILTAIQCCIEEWSSGAHHNVSFKENEFSGAYQNHIAELEKLEMVSGAVRMVEEIRAGITKHGRANAKAPEIRRQDETCLTTDAMNRAINLYKRRQQGGGEFGA